MPGTASWFRRRLSTLPFANSAWVSDWSPRWTPTVHSAGLRCPEVLRMDVAYIRTYHRGMALSIRNPKTEAAVRELAASTGLSLTEAIDMAVRAELERHTTTEAAVAERRQRIQAATAKFRAAARAGRILTDSDLYDDRGLPK